MVIKMAAAARPQAVRTAVKEPEPPPPPTPPAVLRWNNGESLTGEIGASNDAELNWKTPLFEEPLSLAWTAMHRIDHASPESLTPDPFAFTLRDGSRLYGDLAGVSADSVFVHSDRHGELTLRRAEVLSVRRIRSRRLVFAGPLGSVGWVIPVVSDRRNTAPTKTLGDVPTWVTGPGGSLVMPYFDRTAFLRLPLPDRVDMEFRLSARERPAFALSLVDDEKGRVRVETWGDQLVLAAGNGFTVIRPLAEKERSVGLRVCVNRQTRNCQVYTPEGQLLTEWKAPEEKRKDTVGVSLQNKGRNLALDFLRVRQWDGQPPAAAADGKQPGVETEDGLVTVGSVSTVEAGMVTVVPLTNAGPVATFPLETVDAVMFSGDAPEAEGNGTTLTFADGTFLRGQIAGIKDGEAALKTRFSDAPLGTKTQDLKRMFVQVPAVSAATAPEPALKTRDKLVIGTVTMHGELTVTGDAIPRWLPVGGIRAVTPTRTLPIEIIRAAPPEQKPSDETSLFYTRAGDAIPGTLHGMDRKEVEFESSIVEAKSLPTEDLNVIQFAVSSRGSIHGFDAPEWQVIKGSKAEVQQGDKLNLAEGSIMGHASAMQNGEVRFTFDLASYACLRLRMFCEGINPSKGTSFLVCRMGNSMSTGIEMAEGQFNSQNRTMLKSGPVAVRLVIDERSVQCYLNDILVETVPLPATKRAGSGLILEPASLWGNAVESVALTGFSASLESGQAFLPVVNADAKTQALTVPRFRKDDPPRQALLAANGDLLRGEIEAITNTQFGFRVGLEELHVPRERVRAVVALQKPSDQPPPEEEDAIHKLLDRKIEGRTWFGRTNLATLINVIQQAAPELKFKLPAGGGEQSATQYRFDGSSIEDTLGSICELFGLHYRIEKDVIVIDANPAVAAAGSVSVVYWLKPGTFGGKETAEALLAAKGISFAGGTSAKWQESSQCLEVTATPENQAKLVAVLNQDFGGVLGSPTHWLRLTNGGQIGLTVEAFESDVIRGTHPIYGRCRVPMSEVYAIHNTLPGPTPASRVVGGWRLVYAPEPVLPGSGGEGSALLGKNAPLFKLKMLDGGDDFDLGKEKGHVVVLDFWATWCGPCIKALPGMIQTMSQFPADRVKFVGMNQAEPPEQVKRFLNTRGWKLVVAMDIGQNVATQYGVEGIPHTVIVGPDGKVTWVRTGYDEDGDEQVAAEVRKLLATETPSTPAAGMPTQPATAQEIARK